MAKSILNLRSLLLLLIFACLLSACGTLTSTATDTNETEANHYQHYGNLQAEVDSLAKPLIKTKHTPGLIVGVLLADNSQHFYGYGVTNKTTNTTPNADTQFAVGSLSKCFLATITTKLVAEGKLSWNETLTTLLPPGTKLSEDARKITLLQLATHTSGIPRQPMTIQTLSYFMAYLFTGKSFYRHFTDEYVLKYLQTFKAPRHHTQPIYSNIGYGIVGYALELRTGQSLDSLLKKYITQPLKLDHTGYDPKTLPGYAERAHGYAGDQPKFILRGNPVPDWEFTHLMKGSAAIHSTARDLLKLATIFIQNDKNPQNSSINDMLKPQSPFPGEKAIITWSNEDIGNLHIIYATGIVAGYSSYIGLDIKHHSAVVALQNSFNWKDRVGYRLLARIARANQPIDFTRHTSE